MGEAARNFDGSTPPPSKPSTKPITHWYRVELVYSTDKGKTGISVLAQCNHDFSLKNVVESGTLNTLSFLFADRKAATQAIKSVAKKLPEIQGIKLFRGIIHADRVITAKYLPNKIVGTHEYWFSPDEIANDQWRHFL